MSQHELFERLSREADDLAQAIESLLQPAQSSVGRMQWKGPHRDRVQTELATMTRTTAVVAERLRENAERFRQAAAVTKSPLENAEEAFLGIFVGPGAEWVRDQFL